MVVTLTSQGSQSSLWEISALGGSARKLIDEGRSPAVSPDGKEVAFIAGKKLREQVWLVDVDGAEPRKLVGDEGDLFGTAPGRPAAEMSPTRGFVLLIVMAPRLLLRSLTSTANTSAIQPYTSPVCCRMLVWRGPWRGLRMGV
jgi:hypothetical protein